jgi:hypothetical protein
MWVAAQLAQRLRPTCPTCREPCQQATSEVSCDARIKAALLAMGR